MYKSVFVWAPMESYEKSGLFGKKVEESATRVDPSALAAVIEEACNNLERQGFEVVSVMPVDQGMYAGNPGFGWSYTYGAVITAKSAR